MNVRRVSALLTAASLAALLVSCAGARYRLHSDAEIAAMGPGPSAWPTVRFAVFSDPHLYDPALGTEGPAFREYMASDRKMLPLSEELLQAAIEQVKEANARFLIIPGDLTKDGERQDHLLMASVLAGLKQAGIPSFVVPGNHDILNPHAMRFTAAGAERVPWVSAGEFADIYGEFGYGAAIERDPASLSYLAQPVPGLRLLALCSADYADNPKLSSPRTSGRISQDTSRWIEKVLGESRAAGVPVIALMHHGALEHYKGQAKYYGEYLVDDYPAVSDLLASYGVSVVFTGHYHAQDITVKRWTPAKYLYDVETGSLASWPVPVRIVEMQQSGSLRIETRRIGTIPSFAARGENFSAYAQAFTHDGIAAVAITTAAGLGVPAAEAQRIAPQIADAFTAHYAGDERFTGTEMVTTRGLGLMGSIIVGSRRDMITGLWQDREPPDNSLSIDLRTGDWSLDPR